MVFGFLFKKKKKEQPQPKNESNIKGPAPQNITAQAPSNQSQIQSKSPAAQKPGAQQSNPVQKKAVDYDPDVSIQKIVLKNIEKMKYYSQKLEEYERFRFKFYLVFFFKLRKNFFLTFLLAMDL